jgi:hypothetical protein|tara:strand:+ start:2586 stop:2798 length:213 start_codon:yes stop_codon:yes gene_type:complete
MTDIIRRKLDQAKKQLAEMERQANRPAPVERKTRSVMPPLPEDVEKRPSPGKVNAMIEPGPRMKKKWKKV